MAEKSIYLDHAATTPLLPEAREAMLAGMDQWANPSSPHKQGRSARAALEQARQQVKSALAWPGEMIFTSGASEALNIAMTRCAKPLSAVSAVEHEAVLRHRTDSALLAVNTQGQVTLTNISSESLAGLVAIQQANNETGIIQNLGPICSAVHEAGGWLLADCAQSAGKIDLPDADLIAISAHKFGGPIGVGALLVREWSMLRPSGGQEQGYRPGTENLPGILGMVAALEAGRDWLMQAATQRTLLEQQIMALGGEVIAADTVRLPSIGAYRMPGVASAIQLIRFDGMGIAISAGSACSSGSLKGSHVLAAMQLEHANEVIRVSIGRETTIADIDRFVTAWKELAGR